MGGSGVDTKGFCGGCLERRCREIERLCELSAKTSGNVEGSARDGNAAIDQPSNNASTTTLADRGPGSMPPSVSRLDSGSTREDARMRGLVHSLLREYRSEVLGRSHIGRKQDLKESLEEAALLARLDQAIDATAPDAPRSETAPPIDGCTCCNPESCQDCPVCPWCTKHAPELEKTRREERERCIDALILAWNEDPDHGDLSDAVRILRSGDAQPEDDRDTLDRACDDADAEDARAEVNLHEQQATLHGRVSAEAWDACAECRSKGMLTPCPHPPERASNEGSSERRAALKAEWAARGIEDVQFSPTRPSGVPDNVRGGHHEPQQGQASDGTQPQFAQTPTTRGWALASERNPADASFAIVDATGAMVASFHGPASDTNARFVVDLVRSGESVQPRPCVTRKTDTCVYLADGTKVVIRRKRYRGGERVWLEHEPQAVLRTANAPTGGSNDG